MQMVVVEVVRYLCNCFNLLGTSSTDLLQEAEENGGFLEMRTGQILNSFYLNHYHD